MKLFILFQLIIISITNLVNCAFKSCSQCKSFTDSFQKKFNSTSKGSYSGGDTFWESTNLPKYTESFYRLENILSEMCAKDSDCHGFIDEYEDKINQWWETERKSNPFLYDHLCVNISQTCCFDGFFGENCSACPTCFGRGKCEGNGDRKVNATCTCDIGYAGNNCETCDNSSYYKETKFTSDQAEVICKACDKSCDTHGCTGPSSSECIGNCSVGFERHEDICIDVDECIRNTSLCSSNQFCENNQGDFSCLDCDPSCNIGCSGAGSSKCTECKNGFSLNSNGACLDNDECALGAHNCSSNEFCFNEIGSFKCNECHEVCQNGCNGNSTKNCYGCIKGYSLGILGIGCNDIDECSLNENNCLPNHFCMNLPGSYKCVNCDKTCKTCNGPTDIDCLTCPPNHQNIYGYCKNIKESNVEL